MALAASRTLLALFITFCSPGCGWTAEKLLRPQNGKQVSVDRSVRESWESSIHLDGRPVDRFAITASKPARPHHFIKAGKDSRSTLPEDVDPEWVNLDGFAVLGGAPVRNSSTGPVRSSPTVARNRPFVAQATRVNRTANPLVTSHTRKHRRAHQSSTGPRQPERALVRSRLPEKRRQHHTKPQSDQRNRNAHKLTSESVHVVSLQAKKVPGQTVPANRATKTTTPETPEYEAKDIGVRVMSPKSVLISWVDPAVEMGKVSSGADRSYTVRYREKGESARWDYKESTQRRMMIDTLYADSMYEFSVRISQGGNDGKWSISVFQRTPESAPSGPPENFEVKPLRGKGTAVIATWDPPEESNGRIKEYILSYAPAMKPFGMKSVTYRGSTFTSTIDGLTPGERYIFKIRATNRRGQGPQSKVFSVAMPGSRSTASSFPKNEDSHRTSNTVSKQDTDEDKSNLQSTNVQEEPTTSPQQHSAAPTNRRGRPLSQSRSYHSILSTVRGSVRSPVDRGFSRGRAQDREDEEEEDTIPSTPPPVEEATTRDSILETDKEPNNNISLETEDDIEYNEEHLITETPRPKVLNPSRPNILPRRPIKIRVHQRIGSKGASSSSSSPSSSSTYISTSSHVQDSAAGRKEDAASTNPQSKHMYDKTSTTYTKPSTPVVKDSDSQKIDATSAAKSPASTGRTNGSGIGSRYGYSRRYPGTLFRGNSTRILKGYKPAVTSQSSLPRNPDQANTQGSATSQSTLPDRTQNHQITHTSTASRSPPQSENHSPEKSDSDNFDKSQSTLESHGSSSLQTTQDSSNRPFTKNTSGYQVAKVEDPTSSSKPLEPERREKEEREPSTNEKPLLGRSRINPSFLERFPWLASHYPTRLGGGTRIASSRQEGRTPSTRTLSSMGASTPILRGTTTRISGATGAVGVSKIQETSEGLKNSSTHDSLKNAVGRGLVKPSLTQRNTASSDPRSPATSSTSSSSSSSSNGQGEAHESNGNNNDHDKDYLNEKTKENIGENDQLRDPTSDRTDPHRNIEDNQSLDTSSATRSGSTSRTPVHPGARVNGRIHPSLLAKRQFGGSRFPMRTKLAENSRLGSPVHHSSSSSNDWSSSSRVSQPELGIGSDGGGNSPSISSSSTSSSSSRDIFRGQGGRSRYPNIRGNRGQLKPGTGNGKNGRPNLTATNEKESPSSQGISKAVGQKFITGPDGTKWVVDLEHGVLMNQNGQILQDSQGKPKRVVLGEDGHTIFDLMGSPLLNQEGMALFGHGRDSRPVINPKEKVLMVGGKPVVGLDIQHPRIRTTTTTTTTMAPTTTLEPTTTEWTTEVPTTYPPFPTCPPGTFSKTDEYGYPILDPEGILDCYPEEESSGMGMDLMVSVPMMPDTLALEEAELLDSTTLPTTTTTTTTTTSSTPITFPEPDTRPSNHGPSSEFDLSGKKRFTAQYVNYIRKDPGSPCSLTEALEYLQVDVLEDLMEKDSLVASQKQPPKNKPHNLTVVAMEGCHSFIILDWGRPLKDDMVSGYMVHSASYDDVLKNRWSSKQAIGTHLPVENLKPNSRYYFKVQAKNVFGLGPISETLTYVTESDDPLLIERPPGGEPIWIPFTFKYNSAHSSCKGSQYVKRTWYRKFVGVVLCNSLRYKIFMGDGLREPFYSIGDTVGQGEDHCQFVDSYRDGRTGPAYLSSNLPSAQGFYRAFRQEPVKFGLIGRRSTHPFVGWYECGVPIPGKW